MYYNWEEKEKIDVKSSCGLEEWLSGESDCEFAETDEGGKVFLPPTKLSKSDEHKHGDPYSVKDGLSEGDFFERRRFRCTKRMLEREEVGKVDGEDMRILDVGCGEGYITEAVQGIFPDATIVGADYSISAIRRAAARENNIEWVVADAYNLPFEPDYFDIIICTNVWEHVANPIDLLGELRKTAKDGGFLLMSTPSRFRIRNAVRALMGKNVVFMSKNHVTEYTVGQVKECFKFSEMNVIEVGSITPNYPSGNSVKSILEWFLKVIGRKMLDLTKSHHIFESTAFYLAEFD